MLERSKIVVANRPQQIRERRARIERRAQRERVHEAPDDRLEGGVGAIRDHRSDHEVGLTGPPREHGSERRVQEHEEARAVRVRNGEERGMRRRGNVDSNALGGPAARARGHAVGRKLQTGGRVREARAPVRERLALVLGALPCGASAPSRASGGAA